MKKFIIFSVICLFAFANDAVAQFVNNKTTTTQKKAYTGVPQTNSTSTKPNIVFDSYIQTGVIFNGDGAGPIAECSLGVKFYEHLYLAPYVAIHSHFVGIPKELQDYYDKKVFSSCYIPIGANMRILLAKQSKTHIVPFIESTFGGFIGIEEMKGYKGFFCQVGLGIDINRLSLGIGYNGLVKNGTANMGYIKIGITFDD